MVTRIAVDIAKHIFEIACANQAGNVVQRARLSREAFLTFFVDYPAVEVVMEACGSAHHWGRALQARGHAVCWLPVQQVARYRPKRCKTDPTDASALLKAAADAAVQPVPIDVPVHSYGRPQCYLEAPEERLPNATLRADEYEAVKRHPKSA
jgi:transposase